MIEYAKVSLIMRYFLQLALSNLFFAPSSILNTLQLSKQILISFAKNISFLNNTVTSLALFLCLIFSQISQANEENNCVKYKILDLLTQTIENDTTTDASEISLGKNTLKSPNKLISKIFFKYPKKKILRCCCFPVNDFDNLDTWYESREYLDQKLPTLSGEDTYRFLIQNLITDIKKLPARYNYDKLLEILPIFMLYGIHNASVFPPVYEGIVRTIEVSMPLGYYRDQPLDSPIMGLYTDIVRDLLFAKLKSLIGIKEFFILQPINIEMQNILETTIKSNETNLNCIHKITNDKDSVFWISKKEMKTDRCQAALLLTTSSGLPYNGLEAISSGIQFFLKHSRTQIKNNSCNYNIDISCDDFNQLFKYIDKLDLNSNQRKVVELNDIIIKYRIQTCEYIMQLVRNHKFKYVKPFHLEKCQNLMIEVFLPPHVDKMDTFEHMHGWMKLVCGFFGGLINHYANISNEHVYTLMRDSYGFLKPTLSICGESIRLSAGIQPFAYSKIFAESLIELDKALEKFEHAYVLNKKINIVVVDDLNQELLSLSKNNHKENILSLNKLFKNGEKINLPLFLSQKLKTSINPSKKYNYYLNSMSETIKNDLSLLTDHVILAIPLAQNILNSNQKAGLKDYVFTSFIAYLNEMILSRIHEKNNDITLSKTHFLQKSKKQPIYYFSCFDSHQKKTIKPLHHGIKSVLPDILLNLSLYLEEKIKEIRTTHRNILATELKNSFYQALKQTVINYEKIKYLLKKREHFNSAHFYNKSTNVIENTLEYLSILNSIIYLNTKSNQLNNNEINQKNNIVSGNFLASWGEQAVVSAFLWLKNMKEFNDVYLYTDRSAYYEFLKFQKLLKLYPKEAEGYFRGKKQLCVYYFDMIPTLITNLIAENFAKENTSYKINKILSNKKENDITIALIIDVSSTPVYLQSKLYQCWKESKKHIKYLIFVNSGIKNSQLGFDRYQFGEINAYVKSDKEVDFSILQRISKNVSSSQLFIYLRSEIAKIQGKSIYLH